MIQTIVNKKLLILFICFISVFFMITSTTRADYGSLPATLAGPAYQFVNISNVSTTGAFGAYVPQSHTKLYTNTITGGDRTVSVDIRNLSAGNDCSGYRIRYRLYKLDANENLASILPITTGFVNPSMTSQCGSGYPITFNDSVFTQSAETDHSGLYVTRLSLTMEPNTVIGQTAYLLINAPTSPDTRIAYTADGISTIYPRYEPTQ
ncbi:MAG: hypothetical protein AAB914_02295, partial [Patescibacteria group bacterium]